MTWSRDEIAARAAAELKAGEIVNLGIGIPTLIPRALDPGMDVSFHSENGMVGLREVDTLETSDPELMNAGKIPVAPVPGTSYFDSAVSFSMIRGGRVDTSVLGAFQVSERGDIANWVVPGKLVRGIGGAMDLVVGARRVIVVMEHLDSAGNSKLVTECTLPETGFDVVDTVITDRAVFDIRNGKFYLRELAPGVSVSELRRITDAEFLVDAEVQVHQ